MAACMTDDEVPRECDRSSCAAPTIRPLSGHVRKSSAGVKPVLLLKE